MQRRGAARRLYTAVDDINPGARFAAPVGPAAASHIGPSIPEPGAAAKRGFNTYRFLYVSLDAPGARAYGLGV